MIAFDTLKIISKTNSLYKEMEAQMLEYVELDTYRGINSVKSDYLHLINLCWSLK